MIRQFNQGDILQLVSGGPDMTVHSLPYDVLANEYVTNMLDCVLLAKGYDLNQEAHYGPFSAIELELIKEREA